MAAARAERLAEQVWAIHTEPVARRLDRKITRAENRVAELESEARFRYRWFAEHPELARRVECTRRDLLRLDDPITAELLDRLEAVSQPGISDISPAAERADIARIRARLDRLQQRSIDPPALSL
jgi:hypothetical protein